MTAVSGKADRCRPLLDRLLQLPAKPRHQHQRDAQVRLRRPGVRIRTLPDKVSARTSIKFNSG